MELRPGPTSKVDRDAYERNHIFTKMVQFYQFYQHIMPGTLLKLQNIFGKDIALLIVSYLPQRNENS